MNCCTARCGWCGRCETDERQDLPTLFTCDWCQCDAFRPLSLAGVGIACSRDCMDKLAAKHEQRMREVSA
jgi:hypothetical protein